MFQHFTDNARRAMTVANELTRQLNHKYIGTEHVFLGLLKQDSGKAAAVLKKLGVDTKKMLSELEQLIKLKNDTDTPSSQEQQQTQHTKKVVEYAAEEAQNFNHDFIGTEHILLGLLRASESIASQVLINLGVTTEAARIEIEKLTSQQE
jgi:ATP-dependent Clp protease ATP-binding subunit ClpC